MKTPKIVIAALLAASVISGTLRVEAQEAGDAPGKLVRLSGTISALDVAKNILSVKDTKGVETAVTLLPATTYYEREDRLKAADLLVGDVVSTPRVAKTMLTVSSLAPLTFQVGDIGVLIVNKSESLLFSRYLAIKLGVLAVGNLVQGEALTQAGGAAGASSIFVVVKRKPVKR